MVPEEIKKLKSLIWGSSLSEGVFQRWSQGFQWSLAEKCALVQDFGGPCAIIVPVQAFFLRRLLFDVDTFEDGLPVLSNVEFNILSDRERDMIFVETLYEILLMMNSSVWLLCLPVCASSSQSSSGVSYCTEETGAVLSEHENACGAFFEDFHATIQFERCCKREELKEKLSKNLQYFTTQFGVIRLLYSAIMSKSITSVESELDNPEIPLVDSIHGHGSQSLINLFLCGQAVSNVFNGDCDIGGLKLRGIPSTCPIGFLTLLEKLRYCTVGDYLKRPRYPFWIVASETHLTLIFSLERRLVAPDSPLDVAHKIFDRFDPEDNGFIHNSLLPDVLSEMNLVNEPDYVQVMVENLDPEDLGIIVRSKFFDEFFGDDDNENSMPQSFEIFHYNGLMQSSQDNIVKFRKGIARNVDWQENCGKTSDSLVESCLQLRWPGLWITWEDGSAPSLN
ncbi:unnamed protein product [Clavelina lepadiformis]|uniref:Ubiquitin carboxyl-terminal hydrolase MINDY n=1 Tax=Clavelina lepadiformis TaxID=159417 RepID=A0ABP0FZB4_CLALP